MNSHYTYLLIHACAIAGPLVLSFDKKVAYYKKWKYALMAMILPATLFITWDIEFTKAGVWGFNDAYITGWKLAGLPVEEILFFFTIPFCCLFIYECVKIYLPKLQKHRWTFFFLWLLAIGSVIIAIAFREKKYTACTFLFLGVMIHTIFLLRRILGEFDSLSFIVSFIIVLIPFLAVNGLLTSIPVVIYNDTETLGIRIFQFLPKPMNNIPVEDIFYGMLLMILNVTFYDYFRKRKTS